MRTHARTVCAWLAAMLLAAAALADAPTLRVGSSFTASTFGADSSVIVPDTNAAVGDRHVVELLNDRYAVYTKKGRLLQSSTLQQFWTNAGVTVRGQVGDPRVLFDPSSRRWIASTGGFNGGVDELLVAISKAADPTMGWTGFAVPFVGPLGSFIDFPTLGVDREAVYVFSNGAVLVLPKVDLLAPVPGVARASLLASFSLLTPTGGRVQPIVNLDETTGVEPLLAAWDVAGMQLRRWSVVGSPLAPALDFGGAFIDVTPYAGLGNQGAMQPQSGIGINTSSQALVASVVMRDGVLWGVQTIAHQGRAALRWFAIDAATNALRQEGLITRADRDVFMGSIAVNACGDVVIGYNQSGPAEFVSAYAVAGSTVGDATVFGEPVLLKAGVARFDLTGGAPTARWGDYSATVVDPRHPRRFWTIQEWPSAPDVWSTQVTELRLLRGGRGARDDVGDDDGTDDAPVAPRVHAARCRGGR